MPITVRGPLIDGMPGEARDLQFSFSFTSFGIDKRDNTALEHEKNATTHRRGVWSGGGVDRYSDVDWYHHSLEELVLLHVSQCSRLKA